MGYKWYYDMSLFYSDEFWLYIHLWMYCSVYETELKKDFRTWFLIGRTVLKCEKKAISHTHTCDHSIDSRLFKWEDGSEGQRCLVFRCRSLKVQWNDNAKESVLCYIRELFIPSTLSFNLSVSHSSRIVDENKWRKWKRRYFFNIVYSPLTLHLYPKYNVEFQVFDLTLTFFIDN